MVFSPSSLSPRKPKYFYRRLSQSADIGSECNDQADRYGTTARSILKSRHLSMSSSWEMLHGGKDTNGRRFGAYHHAPIQFGKWGAECTGLNGILWQRKTLHETKGLRRTIKQGPIWAGRVFTSPLSPCVRHAASLRCCRTRQKRQIHFDKRTSFKVAIALAKASRFD